MPILLRAMLAIVAAEACASAENIDLTNATVVAAPDLSPRERKAVAMLVEEVERRAQRRWIVSPSWPASGPAIAVGTEASLRALAGKHSQDAPSAAAGPEGYRLWASGGNVLVAGNDARGVLFGVGGLLRSLRMERGSVSLPGGLRIASRPVFAIRGHQLGNRTLNNTVDAWTVPMWEQYFRDLAVFGANAVELLPPQANGWKDSPHSPMPLLDMMVRCSQLLDEYGMDVWIWFPALAKDYSDPATVESELKDWTRVYEKLPRIDAVFVPGGDPGHTHPQHLMPFLEKQARALRRYRHIIACVSCTRVSWSARIRASG
jgi:Glycosyl hydrolase family 20, domain 2